MDAENDAHDAERPLRAVTSAQRYRSEGYVSRGFRNMGLMLLYYLRVPPRVLARLYG